MHTYETIDTPDGPFTVIEDAGQHVVAAGWGEAGAVAARARLTEDDVTAGHAHSADAVAAFYAGAPSALAEVRIAAAGTDFQQAVWSELRAIPTGEVRTYGEVAERIGRPAATRAVGAACGRNPIALIVPCHRVVGASGALTGFAWGVEIKRALLARENDLN